METPDITIILEDTTAPVISLVRSLVWNGNQIDTDNNYEAGSMVTIVVEEQWIEPFLSGTLRITSLKAGYDSGELDLTWDGINKYYFYDWVTLGLIPSDDYAIESTLSDVWGNQDSDGLIAAPDLTIILMDTTPPKQAENLNAVLDKADIKKVYLSWEVEQDNVNSLIFRSTEKIDNISGLEPIAEVTGGNNSYIDILPDEAGEYYYAILLKDEFGNLNYSITDSNLHSIILPEDLDEKPKDEELDDMFFGLGLFGLIAFILVLIILIALVIAFLVINRKKEQPGRALEYDNESDIEDWSSIQDAKKKEHIEDQHEKPNRRGDMKKQRTRTRDQESFEWKRPDDYSDYKEIEDEVVEGEEEWEEEDFLDDEVSWVEE
jgi:hypothetical protein